VIFDTIWILERRRKLLRNKYLARAQGPEAEAKARDLLTAIENDIAWRKEMRLKDQADKLEIPTDQLR